MSLGTREPSKARQLARLLGLAGQSVLARPLVRAMRYDDMRNHVREHFTNLLREFRDGSAKDGPASGLRPDALRASEGLSEDDAAAWATVAHADGADGLLRAFCEARGIVPEPDGRARELLLTELQKGYREYIARALEHTADRDTLALEEAASPAPHAQRATSGAKHH